MSVRDVLMMLFTIVVVSAGAAQGDESGLGEFAPLADFESVEAFEAQLGDYQRDCLTRSGGGSMAVQCHMLYELWDRELNIQYKGLREALDEAGRKKLTESQRDWIRSRDSTIAFNSHLLDFSYSAPGTMWIAIRAGVADSDMAGLVRNRTLRLREWRKRLARGPVDEESLLNE